MHFPIDSVHRLTFLISWLIFLIFTKCKCKFFVPCVAAGGGGGVLDKAGLVQRPEADSVAAFVQQASNGFTIRSRGGGTGPRHRSAAWRWRSPSCRSQWCRRSRPMHGPAACLPPRWLCWRQVCSSSPSSERCPGEYGVLDLCLYQWCMRMLVRKCQGGRWLWSVVFCGHAVCEILCSFAWYAPSVRWWCGLVKQCLVHGKCRCSSSRRHSAG